MRDRPRFQTLVDERSKRVAFVSHCLINQNVRYPGGACFAGGVPAVERILAAGVGLHQMPCPEQVAWGGVTKPWVTRVFGAGDSVAYRFRGVLLPAFLAYTRFVHRRLARRVARVLADYVRSGYDVVAVVGVGDSPSCGVAHTLDLHRALPVVASLDMRSVDRETFNERAVRRCLVEGQGFFIAALERELDRRRIRVPFVEWVPPTA